MNTHDIHNFIVVAESGSLSKAARRLYMTPQGLGKSLKGLEATLGVVLLRRSSRGVELTRYGETFLQSAKETYQSLYRLEHIFDDEVDSIGGRIAISSAPGILSSLTPEYLLSFNTLFPNVELAIRERSDRGVMEDLEAGLADVALAKLPVDEGRFDVYPIDVKRHCALIYEGHRLFGRDTISVRDLRDEVIIIENSDFVVHSKFRQLCESYGFEPEIYFETTEISMAHYLAHLEKGIAISVESEAGRIAHDNLGMAFFEERFVCEWAIVTGKVVSPVVRRLLRHLGQEAK